MEETRGFDDSKISGPFQIDLDCLYYNADTAGGESGGPVYIKDSNNDITVIGIYVCGGNIGVRLNTTIIRFIYNYPNL